MKKGLLAIAGCAMFTAAPVMADPWKDESGHGRHHRDRDRDYRDRDRDYKEHRVSRGDRAWRGNDGRYYCKRSDGTTGLIVGAAAGALLGRVIDSRGERTTGTVLGGAGGALLGREIERGGARCR